MAGSTTANRNRCIEMTKKTTVAGGAATKGGATSKRASAGGSARRPATATNKSTRVRGGSATSPQRAQRKVVGGTEFESGIPAEIDKVIENKFKVYKEKFENQLMSELDRRIGESNKHFAEQLNKELNIIENTIYKNITQKLNTTLSQSKIKGPPPGNYRHSKGPPPGVPVNYYNQAMQNEKRVQNGP